MKTKKIITQNLGDFTISEYEVDENGKKQGRFVKKTYITKNTLLDCFYKDDKLHGLYREFEFNHYTKKYDIVVKKVFAGGVDITSKKNEDNSNNGNIPYSGIYTYTTPYSGFIYTTGNITATTTITYSGGIT